MIIQAEALFLPLRDKSVDCIITSPPYFGCDSYSDTWGIGTDKTAKEYAMNLSIEMGDCHRVLKDNGVLWLIVGDNDDSVPIGMAPQRLVVDLADHEEWIVVQEITWVKNYRVPGRKRFHFHPESKTEKVYMLAKTMGYRYYDEFVSGNVWRISPSRYTAGEWAVLPDEIIKRCLECSTILGDTVLDPFSGSGAVPRFADLFGRVGIGSDINPT